MTSYLCASAVMATLTGWLRRRYGARQLFAGSIGLFVFASLGHVRQAGVNWSEV